MLMGSIPLQTITDMAALAELVKELKAGKAAELLIELRDEHLSLHKAEQAQVARLTEIQEWEEALSKKDNSLQTRETRLIESRETTEKQRREAKDALKTAHQAEEAALSRLEDAQRKVIRIEKELSTRIQAVELKEVETRTRLQEAESLNQELQQKIQTIRETAEALR